LYRTMLFDDLRAATLYMQEYSDKIPISIPGTTAIGTSSAVLRSLKGGGESELGIFTGPSASPLSGDRNVHPNVYDYETVEKIQRVGTAPVMVPVLVNGVTVELPAIQARGNYFGEKAEFLFLDDESNPITLKFRLGIGARAPGTPQAADRSGSKPPPATDRDTLQVVKIVYRCTEIPKTTTGPQRPPSAGQPLPGSRLEQALVETGRVDVYDIYFSFNSAEIREESEPTLEEIAGLMQRHPDWKLNIEGHTDNIAGDAYNLDLSQRRAAAVKNALVNGHLIDGSRLATAGFGRSRPKDTNDTLEGRAHNRRVELARQR
jgi:outer membrane protein OmpA-like peptidoglycan-associated protein